MPSARAGFRPRILISLWWSRRVSAGCPDQFSTTNRWSRLRKRFSFAIGLTRSTPPTPIMGAAGLPPCLKKRGFPWGETGFERRCERWESKGFIRARTSVGGAWNIRSIPIFSGESHPSIRTMCGASILPIFGFLGDGSICSQSSTGSVAMWWPGSSTKPLRCLLSWTVWNGPSRRPLRRSSTVIREATSPVTHTSTSLGPGTSRSRWMAKDGPQTPFLRNGSGEVSNGRRSIFTNTIPPATLGNEFGTGSPFTIQNAPISPWTIEHPGSF